MPVQPKNVEWHEFGHFVMWDNYTFDDKGLENNQPTPPGKQTVPEKYQGQGDTQTLTRLDPLSKAGQSSLPAQWTKVCRRNNDKTESHRPMISAGRTLVPAFHCPQLRI